MKTRTANNVDVDFCATIFMAVLLFLLAFGLGYATAQIMLERKPSAPSAPLREETQTIDPL